MKVKEKTNSMSVIDRKIQDCLSTFHCIDESVIRQIGILNNDNPGIFHQIFNNQKNLMNSYQKINKSEHNNEEKAKLLPDHLSSANENKFKRTAFYQSYLMNGMNNIKSSKMIKQLYQTVKENFYNNYNLKTESTANTTGGKSKNKLIHSSQNNWQHCQRNKKETNALDNNHHLFHFNNMFTFKPLLCNRSLKMCRKLPSSRDRLMQKKHTYHESNSFKSKLIKSPYRKKNLGERDKDIEVSSIFQLNKKSIKKQQNKEKKLKGRLFERDQNSDHCSFHPKINSNYFHVINKSYTSPLPLQNFPIRNRDFVNKKKKKLNELSSRINVIDNQLLTFFPQTNKGIKKDDKRLIKNQIPLINDYVHSMRTFRERSKSKSMNESFRSSFSSSTIFTVSERKFSISSEKKSNAKEIKNASNYRSISMKNIIKKRYEYGIEDYYNANE